MEISKKRLIENGTEVDMPIEWNQKPTRQRTIKYDKKIKRFVLEDIKTKEKHYTYEKLEDLVRTTNQIYNIKDTVIE